MSITAAAGFRAAGIASGIKEDGTPDLALVVTDEPVATAAVFTVNTAAAAPVRLSRSHMAAGSAKRAVVLNSGCANAATGKDGAAAALATAVAVASAIDAAVSDVLVCSTGTIGSTLPVETIVAGVGDITDVLESTQQAGVDAARAIMTTDTVLKEAIASAGDFVVGGMAKGAGMIRPDMATMLVVITTDAVADGATLDAALRAAVDESFHSLNIDGCASTNDTVVLMASGATGVEVDSERLTPLVSSVCRSLAEQMAADAEGASRLVELRVQGAADDATARHAGRAVADSALVRAAFFGGDPNWGRLVGALGASGVAFDIDDVVIAFDGIVVARGGVAAEHDEASLLAHLEIGDFVVDMMIGGGPGRASILTTDLTPEYARLNGERS
ncbi:MAG: bifunctional glutamate N-acetyltransferase/amino-acid acetyltransferase ArgJ [Acidimicrobiia bacterium]|nr:bifunctional glutamate N-acetyltransferase/amino-acid acetyltransferase ArgJ [Acidimicrobiia bacterium]